MKNRDSHNYVFITGMQRSGTTLIGKLLDMHPGISILSQPFPYLFIEEKRRFLDYLGIKNNIYPLGNLYLNASYDEGAFTEYLDTASLHAEDIRQIFEKMVNYSGQYEKFDDNKLIDYCDSVTSASFSTVISELYGTFKSKDGAVCVGGKETLCEEYLPYLINNNFTCIVIIRDPRDVLASLNYGKGEEYAGRIKPTLFNLRNWRKSVAYAINLSNVRRFIWLRYEDLVADPLDSLDKITGILGMQPFDMAFMERDMKETNGSKWKGNSSFARFNGIGKSSVNRYKTILPQDTVEYIETVCYPEMRWLGYQTEVAWSGRKMTIDKYSDKYQINRDGMEAYIDESERKKEEIRRLDLLEKYTSKEAERMAFILDGVCGELRKCMMN